jgi:peptidoglycan lytic transglycosylase
MRPHQNHRRCSWYAVALGLLLVVATARAASHSNVEQAPEPALAAAPDSARQAIVRPAPEPPTQPAAQSAIAPATKQVGIASYYAGAFHGNRTASGERYDMEDLTAAHRTLPFGTRARVTNLHSGESVMVRINDRGPFRKGRILDLSYAAARQLGVVKHGLAQVRIEVP